MSMKKEEPKDEVKGFTKEEFLKGVNDLKGKVSTAKSKITTLESVLQKQLDDRDKAQVDLNDIIRRSSEALIDDKTKSNDGAIEAKQRLDVISLRINEIEASAIPNAKAELEKAKGELLNGTKELLSTLKQSYKVRMDVDINKGLSIGVEFMELAERLLTESGIRSSLNYWEIEPILMIKPTLGKGSIHPSHIRLMGLDR